MPSVFDYWTLLRHLNGRSVAPWLDQRMGENLFRASGSVLALHVPSQQASGPGHLVVDSRGDAAFVTESGVCWEIPHLRQTIDQIYESDVGDLIFFVEDPIGLHVTLFASDSAGFLQALKDPSHISINKSE